MDGKKTAKNIKISQLNSTSVSTIQNRKCETSSYRHLHIAENVMILILLNCFLNILQELLSPVHSELMKYVHGNEIYEWRGKKTLKFNPL